MEKVTPIQAIKKFFEEPKDHPHSSPVTMDELKVLKMDDRRELAAMCAKELGVELA